MIPQLAWLNVFLGSAQRALWDQLKRMEIRSHVDPLKKLAVFIMATPLTDRTYGPFTQLLYAFARANNCYIELFRTTEGSTYTATILIKRRIGPTSNKNPLEEQINVANRRTR